MKFEKYLIILSTKAGTFDQKFIDEIKLQFESEGMASKLEIFTITRANQVEEVVREFANKYGKNGIVYVTGGDGTNSEGARGVAGTECTLGLIPMGTANDFYKVLNYSKEEILKNITNPTVRPIDLMKINDKYCINICSLGFDTIVLKNTYDYLEKYKALGKNAFILGVIKALTSLKPQHIEYEMEKATGEVIEGEGDYLITAICNGRFYGSGYQPSPHSEIDDGIFEIVLIEPLPLFKFLTLISNYRKGTHINERAVNIYPVVKAKLKLNEKVWGNIDGELIHASEYNLKDCTKINFAFYE